MAMPFLSVLLYHAALKLPLRPIHIDMRCMHFTILVLACRVRAWSAPLQLIPFPP